MLVSIIVNNYNYCRYLSESINSALNQSYHDIEVIVVDDGSTDGSQDLIKSYNGQIIPVLKDNGGQMSAINEGFLKSKGEIILLLDADDIFESQKVEKIVEIFKNNSEVEWCFHQQSYVNSDATKVLKKTPEKGTRLCDFRENIISGSALEFVAPSTSGLCFSRKLFKNMSPIPESDDVIISDLYIKIIAMGLAKGFFLDEALVKLRVHDDNRYTEKDNLGLKIKIYRATAFAINAHWPRFRAYANKIFFESINMDIRRDKNNKSIQSDIYNYCSSLSMLGQAKIRARYYMYLAKFLISNFLRNRMFLP